MSTVVLWLVVTYMAWWCFTLYTPTGRRWWLHRNRRRLNPPSGPAPVRPRPVQIAPSIYMTGGQLVPPSSVPPPVRPGPTKTRAELDEALGVIGHARVFDALPIEMRQAVCPHKAGVRTYRGAPGLRTCADCGGDLGCPTHGPAGHRYTQPIRVDEVESAEGVVRRDFITDCACGARSTLSMPGGHA